MKIKCMKRCERKEEKNGNHLIDSNLQFTPLYAHKSINNIYELSNQVHFYLTIYLFLLHYKLSS